MKVTIRPSAPAGSVAAPPGKSMAQRALICAGLARGESLIRCDERAEDVLAAEDCLRALGASVEPSEDGVLVRGCDPFAAGPAELHCRESAAALRFFAPLCALSGREMTLTGAPGLLRRPLDVYEDLFRSRGLRFVRSGRGVTLCGPLTAGDYVLDGGVSSQFVSGLLFALPLLAGDSTIRLRPPVVSRSYIDMTIEMLRRFGVTVRREDETTLTVPGGQRFQPRTAEIGGDWSNAAPFLALGLRVTGLDAASPQGDRVCPAYLAALDAGCPTLDLTDCPDLAPLLTAYAALHGGGILTGTRRLRWKESDRAAAMAEELKKCGADVCVGADTITVRGGVRPPSEPLCGHGDHRVVMALAVLCAHTGGTIDGAEAVSKSFPDFFEKLRSAGVQLTAELP